MTLEEFMRTLMSVSALCRNLKPLVTQCAFKATELLYRELFVYAQQSDELSMVNNSILVNLGLIKVRKPENCWIFFKYYFYFVLIFMVFDMFNCFNRVGKSWEILEKNLQMDKLVFKNL